MLVHTHLQILGSAYLFGAKPEHLNLIYEEEAKLLERWQDSPGEVSKDDWREYLGDPRSVSAATIIQAFCPLRWTDTHEDASGTSEPMLISLKMSLL